MGSHTLQQRESIADSVRGSSSELRWVQEVIDGDNLLHQGGHNTYTDLSVSDAILFRPILREKR